MGIAYEECQSLPSFRPTNRHIHIILEWQEEEDNNLVLLPEDYKKEGPPVVVARVINTSEDCKINLNKGTRILVEHHMVRDITVNDHRIQLIQENYVLGFYENVNLRG